MGSDVGVSSLGDMWRQGLTFSDIKKMREDKLKAELAPPADTQTPTLSDQAIRDAILAERNRTLSGTSRRQAFRVGSTGYQSMAGGATQ